MAGYWFADWFCRSKSWVEEEGEIFRKGAILLGPEEMEGDHAGEDLRREVNVLAWLPWYSIIISSQLPI